ncbi:hypothetical protein REPUB_Repub19eG0058300 [Reevesia pubescens]
MEESEKINGKKKLPSIPSNYVTLLQLQERWVKEQERKQKEKEEKEKEESLQEQEVKEKLVDEVAVGRGSRKNGHFRRYDSDKWKLKEEEIAANFVVNESEVVNKGEELKSEKKKKKKKKWNRKKKNKKEEKAGADNEGEEVVGTSVNAPLPASVDNNNKGEEVVIRDEVHAPKQASVATPRTDGCTVEIGRKFRAMSMKSEIRTGDYCRYGRRNGNFNHRGGNRELNERSYYGKFDRRREQNQRNEGMVWVKKGEVSDGNVSGIQSSS